MKYRYLYQSGDNRNLEGWVRARNREDAYTRLRKLGIKPYRVIGNDPVVDLRACAIGVGVGLLMAAMAFMGWRLALAPNVFEPRPRQQIYGEPALIEACKRMEWAGILDTNLDRYLAAYAIPGKPALPPLLSQEEIFAFRDELKIPMVRDQEEREEFRQLKNIVAWMRGEMQEYLDAGGELGDYLELLEERQNAEMELRKRAEDAVARAPESYRVKVMLGVNEKLRDMGIEPIYFQDGATGGIGDE